MSDIPQVSLEQWATFRAVVEEGSFAKAAERLNKSQSSVSYLISKMESRLPAPTLVMQGRKAVLTELGKVLYRQACSLLDQALSLDRSARSHAKGWEAELVLAADALTPLTRLFCALQQFSEISPVTRVRILETSLSGTDEALLERRAQLAITPHVPVGFLAEPLWEMRMLAVASPSYPLARQTHAISEIELAQARQIVLRDTGMRREREGGWLGAEQRWTVSHFSSSVEAVKAGLGFAFLPEHKVRAALDEGSLVRLNLEIGGERRIGLNMVIADQSLAGPGVKALAEILRAQQENLPNH